MPQVVNPVWFELNRRKHTATEMAYSWELKFGNTKYLHFSVTDGTALYELVYNGLNYIWWLQQIES
jgi:hypothetical protein